MRAQTHHRGGHFRGARMKARKRARAVNDRARFAHAHGPVGAHPLLFQKMEAVPAFRALSLTNHVGERVTEALERVFFKVKPSFFKARTLATVFSFLSCYHSLLIHLLCHPMNHGLYCL